jgi:hypothetical protein
MAQVTGRCWLRINGALVRSKEGATLTGVGNRERTPVVGAQVWGYSEKTVAPTLEVTLAHTADLRISTLTALDDETITFETDTGRTFTLRHAWCQAAPAMSDNGGDVKLTFGCMGVEEG